MEAGERHLPLHPHLSSRVPWVLLAVLASLVLPVPRCVSCPLPIPPAAGPYPTMPPPLPRRVPLPLLLLFTEAKNKLGISWSHQLERKGRWNDKKKLEVQLQLQSGEQPKMGRQPSPEREQKTRS